LEPSLWQDGWLGFIIRRLYQAAWLEIGRVPAKEKVWRAIHKRDQVYPSTGQPKPAFFRDKNGLSVDLARLTTPARSRIGHAQEPYPPETGLVELPVEAIRAVGSDVGHVPIRAPENYAHAQLTQAVSPVGGKTLSDAAVYRIPQGFVTPSSPR